MSQSFFRRRLLPRASILRYISSILSGYIQPGKCYKFGLVSTGDHNLAFEGYILTTSYLEATQKKQNYTFAYPRHENQNFTKLSLSLGSLEKGKRRR